MTYLGDWKEAERRQNPDKFDAAMDSINFRHFMRGLRLATIEAAAAVGEAADRLEEIFE